MSTDAAGACDFDVVFLNGFSKGLMVDPGIPTQ